jgi:hypothetical protein
MQKELPALRIEINETSKAFRVNGVTFAKRHLKSLEKGTNGDTEKLIAKFLVIVPFLATSYTPKPDASESTKYGVYKAKRLYTALGITDDNTVPFMLVALHQAGQDIHSMGAEVREAGFYEQGDVNIPFPEGDEIETHSLSSHPSKPTLH